MDVRRIIIIVGMLALAGVLFVYVRQLGAPAPVVSAPVVAAPVVERIEYKDVLVAKQDVVFGRRVTPEDFQWIQWPAESVSEGFITSDARPAAIEELSGNVSQAPIFLGEPIQSRKLIETGDRSIMSALLAPGMRAVTTRISVASAAGGFIKPGDRVDIILTRQLRDLSADISRRQDYSISETIFENVRVMAIDQNYQVGASGQPTVLGSTATFELSQDDAEYLQEAVTQGDITLTLRSLHNAGGQVIRRSEGIKRESGTTATIAVYRAGQAQQVGLGGSQ
ncbi:MAG: Flp pilus assembly protein CpaB [Maricaulaceae bacterium]